MRCPCHAEISASSRFCPHCGRRAAEELALASTGSLRSNGATTVPARDEIPTIAASRSVEKTTSDTLTPQLPGKYTARLAAGIRPEPIIRDLFEQENQLRKILEAVIVEWPANLTGRAVEEAKEYLRTHCKVCGKETMSRKQAATPLCGYCEEV